MPVTFPRIGRRFSGLLPLLIIASLFVAPLVIWLVKDDGPAVMTDRLKAKIVSIGPAVERDRRVVVDLQDGLTVVIRSARLPPDAKAGDQVEILRSRQPTGAIDYTIDR